MRVRYVVTGPFDALEPRRAALQAWASPGVEVDVVDLPGAPASIESETEAALAVPHVIEAVQVAEREGADAVVVGCFGDPGVEACRELVAIPVVGPGAASLHVAALLGHRCSILTVLDSVVASLHRLARAERLDGGLASVLAFDVPVLELDEGSYPAIAASARTAIDRDGADALVLGCMSLGFLGVSERLAAELGVPVVNPPRVALRTAELLVGAGLAHGRRAYPAPVGPG